MNKKIFFIIAGVIVILVIGYIYKSNSLIKDSKSLSENLDTKIENTETKKIEQKPEVIGVYKFQDLFKGESKDALSPIKTSRGLLSFKLLTDVENSGTLNQTFDVLLDNEKLGEVGGQGFIKPFSSPDKSKYILRERGRLGCVSLSQSFGLKVIDLKTKKVIRIQYPNSGYQYHGSYACDSEFIESYMWKDNDNITMTTFLFLVDKEHGEYRASPKQVWNYNILTKEYSLISES